MKRSKILRSKTAQQDTQEFLIKNRRGLPTSAHQVSKGLGVTASVAAARLGALAREGKVTRVSRGMYQAVTTGPTTEAYSSDLKRMIEKRIVSLREEGEALDRERVALNNKIEMLTAALEWL